MARKKETTNFEMEFDGAEKVDPAADMAVEMGAPAEDANTEVSTETPADAPARETYTLADGTQGSRSAYIRELFLTKNLTRREISEQYGFAYRIVYSATVNMTNEAEGGTGRGRGAVSTVIKVATIDDNELLVEIKEIEGSPVVFVNGEATAYTYDAESKNLLNPETGEIIAAVTDKHRNVYIQEQVNAGVSRGDLARLLDVSYGVIYAATKDVESSRVKHEITLENGETISRNEYIRRRFAEGVSRGDIAKELDVQYSIVWQATKTDKSDEEKLKDLIASLKAFAGKVVDTEAFNSAIAIIEAAEIKPSAQDEQDAKQAEANEAETEAAAAESTDFTA